MNYNRREVKLAAKSALRQTTPRHWLVTLVYLLLSNVPYTIVTVVGLRPIVAISSMQSMGYPYENILAAMEAFWGGSQGPLLLFLGILLALFNAVLGFGYRRYCLNVYRRQESGYHDLFHGFSMAGRVICLELLIFLFSFLWGLVAFAIIFGGIMVASMISVPLLLASSGSTTAYMVVVVVLVLLAYLGGFTFLYSRILRYKLAPYLLMDHPDWSATDALNESKERMKGRRWSLVVLGLSFLGWQLLDTLIVYGILFAGAFAMGLEFLHMQGINYQLAPYYIIYSGVGGVLLFLAARLCALPLDLWLTCYQTAACAGFYDAGLAPQAPGEAPPVWDPHPSQGTGFYGGFTSQDVTPPPPPPPPQDPGPAGSFYSGFPAPEAPQPPAEPEPPAAPPEPPPAPEEVPKDDDPWAGIDTKGPDLP